MAEAVSGARAVLRAVVEAGGRARDGQVVRNLVDVHGVVDRRAPQALDTTPNPVRVLRPSMAQPRTQDVLSL